MASIRQSEPPTNGKVVLNTTLGALDIELWSKEAPKATRNFVQLCLDGFYNQCQFFRVIPKFIAQAGDPTNTGSGPHRTYLPDNALFANEIHSRLRFGRMGLVCCAGTEEDVSLNANQFFITLDKTPELDKKHTIFGKVVGNSIYNLMNVNEMDLEPGFEDRLAEPPCILSADVVWNPFDDVFPRESAAQKAALELSSQPAKPASSARAIKNFGLLSFGDEAEDDEVAFKSMGEKIFVAPTKSKSKPKMAAPRDSDEEEEVQSSRQSFKRQSGDDEDDEWQRQMDIKSKAWSVAERKADRRDERIEARKEAKRKAMRGKTESESDEASEGEDGKPTYRNRKEGFVEDINAPKFKKRKLSEDQEEVEAKHETRDFRRSSSTNSERAPRESVSSAPVKTSVKEDAILAKLAAFKSKISTDKKDSRKSEEDDWKAVPLVFDASLEEGGDMNRDMQRDDYVVLESSESSRDWRRRSPERTRRDEFERSDYRNERGRRDYSPAERRRDDQRPSHYRRSPERRESDYRGGNDRSRAYSPSRRSERRYEDDGRYGGRYSSDDRQRRSSPPRSYRSGDSQRTDRY